MMVAQLHVGPHKAQAPTSRCSTGGARGARQAKYRHQGARRGENSHLLIHRRSCQEQCDMLTFAGQICAPDWRSSAAESCFLDATTH